MCKVFMISGIKKDKQILAKKLVFEMSKIISRSETDGIGYAAITKTGKVYGEKWLKNEDAFIVKENPPINPIVDYMRTYFGETAKFIKEPVQDEIYCQFGDNSDIENTVAVILHARKATFGSKSVVNTHPFYFLAPPNADLGVVDTALIHNGSIYNHEHLKKVMSTCDSEVILHEYLDFQMNYNPWAMPELARKLAGEYAVGVLTSVPYDDGTIMPVLDIFKSNKDLCAMYVPELETVVFGTSEYNLEEGVKSAGMTPTIVMSINNGFLMRFNAITGVMCEDPVPFELSSRSYYLPPAVVHPMGPGVSNLPRQEVIDDADETIEDVKENFEHNHSTIFTQQYFDAGGLNQKEKALWEKLDGDKKTNHKALRLVAAVLNIGSAS